MSARAAAPAATSLSLLTPVVERWRTLAALFVVTTVLVGAAVSVLRARRYEARVVLATVASSRLPGNAAALGGLASLAGLAGQAGGLTADPDLVAALLGSRRVLLDVARQPFPQAAGPRARPMLVAVTADPASTGLAPERIERKMRDLTSVAVDKRTGLITLSVAHPDSAVARAVLDALLRSAVGTFTDLARSQARAQRLGLEARVDSMQAQLRRAEVRAGAFRNENRVIPLYSPLAIEEQQLGRDVSIAQQAYLQAIGEREAAVARELEQTPSVVTVDPVPPQLDPLPKYAVFTGLAAAVGVTFVALTVLYLLESLRELQRRAAELDPHAERLVRATRRVPLLGRLTKPADAPAG